MLVRILKALLALGFFTTLDVIFKSNLQPPPWEALAILGALLTSGVVYVLLARLERHPTIVCPQCGLTNIPQRSICKRCRADIANTPIRPA